MAIPLDEVVTFDLITRGSGGVTDADSAPTYDIFEDTTDTPILAAQTMTKRTSLTGNYRGSFTASAANGFEVGKWYNVIGTGIVGGIIDKTVAMTFMLCAAESAAGVPKVDAAYLLGTAIATPATAGILDVNAKNWGNSVVTGMPMPTYTQPTGFLAATFPAGTIANTTNITAGTITTVTTLTNLPSITANWLTAAGINAGALNGKGDWLLASSYTAPPTTTQIATGVWTDTTAGDFTTALSIGKSVMNGVALGTGLTVNALTTNNDKTGYSLAANQHVIVDSGTVTTLTNLPAITANWLTAAGINADAFTAAKFAADVGVEFADAIWDEVLSGHLTAGTTGNALNTAGSAGDPWATALPGAYTGSQAGALLAGVNTKIGTPITQGSGATLAANLTDIAAGDFGYHLDLATKIGTPVDLGSGTATVAANLFDLDNKIGVPATSLSGDIAGVPDALLGRNIKGGSSTGRKVSEALAASRNKVIFDVPGAGQFTVMDTDDVTPLWVGTYTRGANTLGPLTAVDPT